HPHFTSILGRPIVMQLICARNVVKCDRFSESDPYVIASVRTGDKANSPLMPNSVEYRWPTVDDEANPGWYTTVWLAKQATEGSFLHVKLFDDDTTSDELLGSMIVPVEKLVINKVITFHIPYEKDNRLQHVDVMFREYPPSTR